MKTYKCTNQDMQCRGFRFELGKTYTAEGELILCNNGFHSCVRGWKLVEYNNLSHNRIFECEIGDDYIGYPEDKLCSRNITLVRELTFYEAMRVLNKFDGPENTNIGFGNVGNENHGNDNLGNENVGSYNTGNNNHGNSNQGNYNTGTNNKS